MAAMISPEAERRIVRILLGMESSGPELPDIEPAVRLARLLEAEISGVFVQDDDLLRSAALPFAVEIPLAGGAPRALDMARLERALRMLAQRTEAELERAAESARIRWSFRVVRGRRMPTMLGEAGEGDLVVLARTPHSPAELRQAAGAHTVAVLFDGSEAARHAVALAARLVGHDGRDLLLLDVGLREAEGDARAAQHWLRSRGVRVALHPLAAVAAERVLNALRGNVPLLLILPAGNPEVMAPGFIDRLHRQLPAPLALVR